MNNSQTSQLDKNTNSKNTKMSPKNSPKTSPKNKTQRTPFCNFCSNLGKSEEESKGHWANKCPVLAEYECQRCKEKGHSKKHCTAQECRFCKNFGHLVETCPKITEHTCKRCKENGHRETRCHNYCNFCRKNEGHIIDNCPNKKCSFCGEKGHLRGRECPLREHDYYGRNK